MHDQPNQPGDPDNSNTAPMRQDPVVVLGYALSDDFGGAFSFSFYRGGGSAHTQQAAGRNYVDEDIDGLRVWRNDDGTYGWEAEKHGWFDRNGNGEYEQGDLDLSPGEGNDR